MKRRDFLKLSATAGLMAAAGVSGVSCRNDKSRALETTVRLPELPFAKEALEPYISVNTINVHYGKHHQGYVNKINTFIAGTRFEKMPLEEIIRKSSGQADQTNVFNNAAQVFNHTFYWKSMKPGGGGKPTGKVADAVNSAFGDYDTFAAAFAEAAKSQFGSGWAWLVREGGKLKIVKTSNADTPIAQGMTPIFTIDVWEHAYYLDYQNRRGDYVQAYLDHLINWDFAAKNL